MNRQWLWRVMVTTICLIVLFSWNSNAIAYDTLNHRRINSAAYSTSDLDTVLHDRFGWPIGADGKLAITFPSPLEGGERQIHQLLAEGGEQEDDQGEFVIIPPSIVIPPTRTRNHFHDPTLYWTDSGLKD